MVAMKIPFFVFLFFVFSIPLFSQDRIFSYEGVALRGYDAVSYFTDPLPTKGASQISLFYMGTTWLFATEKHRIMFQNNPESYIPQYGGYCAETLSTGFFSPVSGTSFYIEDRKLYLFLNEMTKKSWRLHSTASILSANKAWKDFLYQKRVTRPSIF